MIDPRPISEFKFTQEEYDAYQRGEEIWRDIPSHIGEYQISTFGRVKSLSRIVRESYHQVVLKERIIKPFVNQYYFVKLPAKNGRDTLRIHRMQAILFLNNPDNKPEVNHIDAVKTNVHLSNLEWNTRLENARHAHRMGLCRSSFKGKYGKDSVRSKTVLQYSIEGEYIATFNGCEEAKRNTGCNSSNISACALGKLKSTGGFKWKYECDLLSLHESKNDLNG